MATKIGLDFGYANIAISDSNAGVYREQSVALIDKDTYLRQNSEKAYLTR